MQYHIRLDKKKPETKRYLNDKLNLRLSKEHKRHLKKIAKENRISISELIRRVLKNNY